MEELILNVHMHTTYSDGHGTHADIARAAAKSGLDAVIVTDHNVFVSGPEGYYHEGGARVLLLVGEEIHNQVRDPQKNHLLVFGAGRELATFASDPQNLLDQVKATGGLAFIAHPFDDAMPAFGEDDLSWVDWQVNGYTGIELWNHFSELKSVAHNKLEAFFYALNPKYMAHAPLTRTLRKWDELHQAGKKVVAIGGADAHANPNSLGPITRIIFPYEFHFQCINNHLLVPSPLQEDVPADRQMILDALRLGHCYVGYDLPLSTRGFRFTANSKDGLAIMGDEISGNGGVTLQIHLPARAECQLIQNGKMIKTWQDKDICTYNANTPGVYRVEAYIQYLGTRRGWIFSNPIYIR
jgi:hypothetical protein